MTSHRPWVIGHRGAPGYLPEHTASSYRRAISDGVDAVEPDVVFTRDGVAVIRHENEIGSTTDVAVHPDFADRRTTKTIDGEELTGWFTEDFTFAELATLRCRERVPELRPESARHDGEEPLLRLRDLLDLVGASGTGIVLEVKHATYFGALGFDVAGLLEAELREAGWADGTRPLTVESFELGVLDVLRGRGLPATYVFLIEASGTPADLRATDGADALPYGHFVTDAGLDSLVGRVDGISVDKSMILEARTDIVRPAQNRGLIVFTWTCRPENAFLAARFRQGSDRAAFGEFREEWRTIAASGVDGVFVDHSDLGVSLFRRE